MTLTKEATSAINELEKTLDRLARQARYLSYEERDEVGVRLGEMILRSLGNLPPPEDAPEHTQSVAPWRHPSMIQQQGENDDMEVT